jgi:hypothetical protein
MKIQFPASWRRRCLIFVSVAVAGGVHGAPVAAPRNILWDGGLQIGYGNAFWGAPLGNQGPSSREAWRDGVVTLDGRMTSRVYGLDEGAFTLCAWVRQSKNASGRDVTVTLLLTNDNTAAEKQKNEFRKTFTVGSGRAWQRVGWTFELRGVVRPYFHVEASSASGGVEVDAVSLTAGAEMPAVPTAAADLETGFFIPEETGIYVDGEERAVDLVICNHGPARRARVHWEIYDYRESRVRGETLDETWPADSVQRRRLALGTLPHGGYRFASSVEGQAVLGDALLALLPRIDQDAFPTYGGDAAVTVSARNFTGRWMKRLGMRTASTLSPGGMVSRWPLVQTAPNQFSWQDAAVDGVRREGIELIGMLGLKFIPAWLVPDATPRASVSPAEQAKVARAFAEYTGDFVRHYGARIPILMLEDEIHNAYDTPEKLAQLKLIYEAARAAARDAARAQGTSVLVGVNGSFPEWWAKVIDTFGADQIDFVSQNSSHRPLTSVATLNLMREKKCYPPYFITLGVGQKSVLRQVSLMQGHALAPGSPMGLFAWQFLTHAWLSRPYGTDDVRAGPIVRFGYYDLRVLGQSVYAPNTGKTGVEYDNSPTLGLQAMAMLKHHLSGLRAARDPAAAFSLDGVAMRNPRLHAYPFRDGGHAAIVLCTTDGSGVDQAWRLRGADWAALRPVNLYGHPLTLEGGAALPLELPVIIPGLPARQLDAILAALRNVDAEAIVSPARQRLEVGAYVLDIDPDRAGFVRLFIRRGARETLVLDGLVIPPGLPKPALAATPGRLSASASLTFDKNYRVGVTLTSRGATLVYNCRNVTSRPLQETVRWRLSPAGMGRDIVIQNGTEVIAGHVREDYGRIFPLTPAPAPAPLDANAARVALAGFAHFDLPPASGRGFSPATGLRWQLRDGEALLEAGYALPAYVGGGSRGTHNVVLTLHVTAPDDNP